MRAEYDFSKATRGPVLRTAAGKTRITIRIDDDVLEWFRAQGRAGMAALALEPGRDTPFDAQAFYELAVSKLPSYAVPVFLRLQFESDVTGTFKLRKVALRRQGYDPGATDDPIYVRHDAAGTYVRVRDAADARVR